MKLLPNEVEVWKNYKAKVVRYSRFSMIFFILVCFNIAFSYGLSHFQVAPGHVFLLASMFSFLSLCYLCYFFFLKSKRPIYILTNQRIIIYNGILSRDVFSEYLERILEVEYRQTISQRLLKTGTIHISTASEGGNPERQTAISDIDDVEYVYNLIMQTKEEKRHHH